MSDSDLLEKEQNAENLEDDLGDSSENEIPYHPEDKKGNLLTRGKSKLNNNKKKLSRKVLPVSAVGGLLLILAMVAFMALSSAKTIHLAENVTVYNMARSARNFRQSFSNVTSENIATSSMTESRFTQLSNRFTESKVGQGIEKINRYRPKKVLQKLSGSTELVFEEGEPYRLKILGKKQIFKGVNYGGNFVEKADKRFFHPIESYKEKIRFSAELDAVLEQDYKGTKSLVRGSVLRQELKNRGIKLHWWEKKSNTYKNLKAQAAEYLEQKKAYESRNPKTPNCKEASVCDATNKSKKAVSDAIAKPVEGETAAALEERATVAAATEIESATTDSVFKKVVSSTSIVYAVAVPLCLIFDGSIENSAQSTDEKDTSLQKSYFSVRSAADQQKKRRRQPRSRFWVIQQSWAHI